MQLGLAVSGMLKGYTTTAASVITAMLKSVTRFTIQVGFFPGGGREGGRWVWSGGQTAGRRRAGRKDCTPRGPRLTGIHLPRRRRAPLQVFVALILGFFTLWDLPMISRGIASLKHVRPAPRLSAVDLVELRAWIAQLCVSGLHAMTTPCHRPTYLTASRPASPINPSQSRLAPIYDEVAPVLGVFGKLFGKALEAQVGARMGSFCACGFGFRARVRCVCVLSHHIVTTTMRHHT